LAAGLTQRAVARAAKISQPRISHFERSTARGASLAELSVVARAVGLKVAVTCHPVLDALRDSAQRRLIEVLCLRLPSVVGWKTEVPIPLPGDRRAVDAVLSVGSVRIAVEAWTRLDDLQAQTRAAQLKRRDIGAQRLVMLVADSAHNRSAVRAGRQTLLATFPLGTRAVLAALSAGRDPGGDGVVMLRISRS
jgi:transcriptional regulator with XRE-family HTH domain